MTLQQSFSDSSYSENGHLDIYNYCNACSVSETIKSEILTWQPEKLKKLALAFLCGLKYYSSLDSPFRAGWMLTERGQQVAPAVVEKFSHHPAGDSYGTSGLIYLPPARDCARQRLLTHFLGSVLDWTMACKLQRTITEFHRVLVTSTAKRVYFLVKQSSKAGVCGLSCPSAALQPAVTSLKLKTRLTRISRWLFV